MQKDLSFEVWKSDGRYQTLVARFRRREDAQLYVRRFGEELELKIRRDGQTQPPRETEPPRRHSDIVIAREHAEEFIADELKESNGDE